MRSAQTGNIPRTNLQLATIFKQRIFYIFSTHLPKYEQETTDFFPKQMLMKYYLSVKLQRLKDNILYWMAYSPKIKSYWEKWFQLLVKHFALQLMSNVCTLKMVNNWEWSCVTFNSSKYIFFTCKIWLLKATNSYIIIYLIYLYIVNYKMYWLWHNLLLVFHPCQHLIFMLNFGKAALKILCHSKNYVV